MVLASESPRCDRIRVAVNKNWCKCIGNQYQLNKSDHSSCLRVGDNDTRPVGCARNLGVWFNEKMSMSHIAKACSSVFFHLHNIRSPKKYLSVDSLQTIEHALITTQLDYYNRPNVQISKLQHVQNAIARLIIMSIIIMDIPNISSHT